MLRSSVFTLAIGTHLICTRALCAVKTVSALTVTPHVCRWYHSVLSPKSVRTTISPEGMKMNSDYLLKGRASCELSELREHVSWQVQTRTGR